MHTKENQDSFENNQDMWKRIKSEKRYENIHYNLEHRIKELEQEKMILKALNEYILNVQVQPSDLIDFYSNIMNSLVPVIAYLDLMLAGNYGALNGRQKAKLQIMKDSVDEIIKKRTINTIHYKKR